MQSITNALEAFGKSLLWNGLHRIKYLPCLMLCVIGMSLTVIAAPSDLDPTFGSGGKVISSPNGSNSIRGYGMALQSDGKIILVGGYDSQGPSFIAARYNVDGSLDTTFGTNGWVSVTFGGNLDIAVSVAIQSDGKIVVAGLANTPNQDAALARLNPNGTLDTTFSGDGKVTVNFVDFQGSYPDYISVVKIANDGKIVFAGGALGSNFSYKAIVGRLNPDGSLDTTFDGDGTLVGAQGSGSWKDLVVLADGAIVLVSGASSQFFSSMSAVKYSNSGASDWSYGRSVIPGCYIGLNGIAAQPDGKVVVVGKFACKMTAIRLNTNGTEDNTFNNTTLTPDGEAFSVAIQPDGKIVANIAFNSNGNGGFSLIRYNANGSLDLGFGSGGTVSTSVGDPATIDGGRKVLLQPDEKILVGGSALSEGYRFAMVRYRGGASVPVRTLFDYDGDGKADVSVFRPSENKWFVLRSSDLALSELVFAIAGDIPVPADYDGDGKTDFAIFRPSTGDWWYSSSINNSHNVTHWGQAGDLPRPSDFDGDGKTDFISFRPSNSVWYRFGSTGATSITAFGSTGDKPVTGDFDGDGKSDLAIYRPSTGDWWYQSSITNAWLPTHWGTATDVPAPADYDGDGKTDVAVYRPSNGTWYILNSGNGTLTFVNFGVSEDKPVPADYDGDGKADIAVFRPSNGTWYLLQTSAGFASRQWGVGSDIPTENAFIP